jgi:hypothetical protein
MGEALFRWCACIMGTMSPMPSPTPPDWPTRLAIALAAGATVLAVGWLLRVLLPWLMVLGGIAVVAGCWHRHQQRQRYLYAVFYDCLQATQGKLSVLDFAIATQLPSAQARAFLDARAKELWAEFEPTPQGDVLYTFPLRQVQS